MTWPVVVFIMVVGWVSLLDQATEDLGPVINRWIANRRYRGFL
jgi:hypothetical protein